MAQRFNYSRFETEIDLIKYAALFGYEIDREKDCPSWRTMRSNADKVIIFKKAGKWRYFNRHDENDYGNITNFIRNRTHKTNIEIGLELNRLIGESSILPTPKHYNSGVEKNVYDPKRVQNIFKSCQSVIELPYLGNRGLTASVLGSRRFAGSVFKDRHGNAAFPHYKHSGVCGLELKGPNTACFVKGSEKTLWRSNRFAEDKTLIIAEAVIDALSYEALHLSSNAFYAATGGGLSKTQERFIQELVNKFTALERIIVISDNDKGGDHFAAKIQILIEGTKFTGSFLHHSPEQRGDDWNDVLQLQKKENKNA